jgi:hypothetical protein
MSVNGEFQILTTLQTRYPSDTRVGPTNSLENRREDEDSSVPLPGMVLQDPRAIPRLEELVMLGKVQ